MTSVSQHDPGAPLSQARSQAIGVRVVRGEPSEEEIVALIAGLVTMSAATAEPEEQIRQRHRWQDPARTMAISSYTRAGSRGPDEWRWSVR